MIQQKGSTAGSAQIVLNLLVLGEIGRTMSVTLNDQCLCHNLIIVSLVTSQTKRRFSILLLTCLVQQMRVFEVLPHLLLVKSFSKQENVYDY